MRFLGPESCALSIVEGRSTDGTFEVLAALRPLIEDLGGLYFFNSTDIDPSQGARIAKLAELRNMALAPILSDPTWYSDEDTNVIFLNDVAICSEDILELLHQRIVQSAAMTCAMDWTYVGEHPTFYDVWIARDMAGETFFNIPPDGNWDSAWNLFWANDDARARYNAHLPFQVFSCWNGAVVFSAKPILEKVVDPAFHATGPGECFRGEPEVFCKELWKAGHGRIAVVPSVNLEYSDGAARKIKELKGYTRQWVGPDGDPEAAEGEASWRIGWVEEPPKLVKCMASYENQTFVPWDEGL
jgi:alpha-1,3-mannosyltransferase